MIEEQLKQGQLSKHFWRHEFECRDGCGFDTVDAELIRVLEDIHDHFKKFIESKIRIIILNGNRCIEYNEDVQKECDPDYVPYSSKSTHMDAIACDFMVEFYNRERETWHRVLPDNVAKYLKEQYPDCYGLGRYVWGTHLDVRKVKARW